MAKEEKSSRAAVIMLVVVVLFLLLPVLYVLSVGPVAWLITHEYLPLSPDGPYFWPIAFLCSHSAWFNSFMVWYLSCFVDLKSP
jgi:hypothetical protein